MLQRGAMARFVLQVALLLFVVLYAWTKGGRPERHVSFILFAMLVATIGRAAVVGQWTDYEGIPWFRVGLDILAFILLVGVALRADRWWPLWVASAQLLSVLAHLLRVVDARLPPLAYAVMERWPYMIAILLTGLGTYLHARRQATATAS